MESRIRDRQASADAVEFVRFCYRRRRVGWPELYDEMCGVAARREFHGWDHADLASRGLTFSLFEMPRLAGWVRAVVDGAPDDHASEDRRGVVAAGRQPHGAVA